MREENNLATETALIKEPIAVSNLRRLLNKIQGNDIFERKVQKEKKTILKSLVKDGQVMPLILYLKKQVMNYGEKGDGINTYKTQGVEEKEYREKLKVDKDIRIMSSHDVAITKKMEWKLLREN